MTDSNTDQGFNDDQDSLDVRAVKAIHRLLTTTPGISPADAFLILLSAAGEIVAEYFAGDTEALIAEVPEILRGSVTHFTERNSELIAAKRRGMT